MKSVLHTFGFLLCIINAKLNGYFLKLTFFIWNRLVKVGPDSAISRDFTAKNEPKYGKIADMKTIGGIIDELSKKKGIFSEIKVRTIFSRWESVVGSLLAEKTKPVSLNRGVLTVWCSESIWASELKFYTKDILAKMKEQLQDVRDIRSIKIVYKE